VQRIMNQAFVVEYFKQLSDETCDKFNVEIKMLTEQFDQTRKNNIKSEKKVQVLLHFIKIQERTMQEMRSFMFESMNKIF
jgi:hypothetical protein